MDLPLTLDRLENAQLIRRASDAERSYIFKHVLTQDTAYGSLLHAQRRAIHRRVARAYEAEFGEQRLDDYAGILAKHYAEAGDDTPTLVYATRAGDLAARVYANAEAIGFYALALETAKRSQATTTQLIHLYTRYGRTLEITGEFEKALSAYEEMADLARLRQDRALELSSLMLRATLRSTPVRTFDPALGQQLSDRALALAEELNEPVAETKILWNLQLLSMHSTQPQRAVEYGERGLALARELSASGHDLREQIAFLLNDLTIPYLLTHNPGRSIEVNAQARELWRELDNKPMLADNLGNLAQFQMGRGEFERAIATAREGAAIAQSVGNDFGILFNKFCIAACYLDLGEFDATWREGSAAVRLSENVGGVIHIVGLANMSMLFGLLGEKETSREFGRRAHAGFRGLAPAFFRSIAYAFLADADVLRGELAQAAEDIAASRAERTFDLRSALWSHLGNAETGLALAQDDPARAIAAAEASIQTQKEYEYRWMLPELLYLRGMALSRQGQTAGAYESIAQARETAQAINQRRTLWRICAALGEMEIARGNLEQAHAYHAQARDTLEFIVAHTPKEFRASFLNLPDVRKVLAQ